MNRELETPKLKWYHMRRTRLTAEYCGGLLAGMGGGAMLANYAIAKLYDLPDSMAPEIYFVAPLLIVVGTSLAEAAQRRTKKGATE